MKTEHNPAPRRRRGLTFGPFLIGGIGVVGVAALAVVYTGADTSAEQIVDRELASIKRGSFDITIPAGGELTAARQVEVRNPLKSRAVITWIIDEGQIVDQGELLIRFNDEEFKDSLIDAENQLTTARNQLASAESELEIKKSERDSEMSKADLKITLAQIALKAWEEGDAVSRREQLELDVETAKKNLERLKDWFEQSRQLLDEEFISLDQYKQDEIALLEASSRVTQAERALLVYKDYIYEQDRAQKESDLEQASAERDRTEERYVATVERAINDVESRRSQVKNAEERVTKLKEQIAECVVHAPSGGLVVYGTSLESSRHGWDQSPPQVGTEMHRNELVMVLPDTTSMVAEVKVNEALSGLIEPGQKVTAMSDALPEVPLSGEVVGIGVLAETGGWRDPNRRDYKVRILLDQSGSLGLKPSMRCQAEIFVGRVEDVLYAPIPAIHHEGGQSFVYVPSTGGYAQRPVEIGRSSELYVEIPEGLAEGDRVLLREPGPEQITATIPAKPEDEGQRRAGRGPRGPRGGKPTQAEQG